MELIADTSLLVGLWRRQSWAVDFARANSGRVFGIPWIVLGEFWHGAMRAGHDQQRVESFLGLGLPVCNAEPVVFYYAKLCTQAQEDGYYNQIGQNDLWIAATSLSLQLPLVTRNRRHFYKIRDLRLQSLTD